MTNSIHNQPFQKLFSLSTIRTGSTRRNRYQHGCQAPAPGPAPQLVPQCNTVLAGEPPQPPQRPDGPNRPAGQARDNRGHRHNSAQLRGELWFEHCNQQVQTERLKTAESNLRNQQLSSRLEQQEQKLTEQKTKLSKIEEIQKEELSKKQSLIRIHLTLLTGWVSCCWPTYCYIHVSSYIYPR